MASHPSAEKVAELVPLFIWPSLLLQAAAQKAQEADFGGISKLTFPQSNYSKLTISHRWPF